MAAICGSGSASGSRIEEVRLRPYLRMSADGVGDGAPAEHLERELSFAAVATDPTRPRPCEGEREGARREDETEFKRLNASLPYERSGTLRFRA